MTLREFQAWINDGDTAKPSRCGDLTVRDILALDERHRFGVGQLQDGRLIILNGKRCFVVYSLEEIWDELNCYERSLLRPLQEAAPPGEC